MSKIKTDVALVCGYTSLNGVYGKGDIIDAEYIRMTGDGDVRWYVARSIAAAWGTGDEVQKEIRMKKLTHAEARDIMIGPYGDEFISDNWPELSVPGRA